MGKIGDFGRKSPFIPETVRGRPGNNPKHFFHSFCETDYSYAYTFLKLCSFAIAFAAYIFLRVLIKSTFTFFACMGTCYVL